MQVTEDVLMLSQPERDTAADVLSAVGTQARSMANAVRGQVQTREWLLSGLNQIRLELERAEEALEFTSQRIS